MLREYAEPLEADFQHFYQLDLSGLWRGEHPPRWYAVRARWLPAGAATWDEAGDDRAWDAGAHLTALAVDHLAAGNWQRGGDKSRSRPKPVPRPAQLRAAMKSGDVHVDRARRFLQRQQEARDEGGET